MTTIVLYCVQPMLSAGLEKTLADAPGFRLAAVCTNLSQVPAEVHRTDATLALIDES